MALIYALTMTMKNKSSLLLFTVLLAGLIHTSEEYGHKDLQHSYTRSFTSSSSSAHASAYSSSSSYSYGSGNNVPIIGPIPKAAAVATASAGATSLATANAHASAGAGFSGVGGSYGGSIGSGYGGTKVSGSYGQSADDTGSGGYHKSTGGIAGSIGGSGYGSSSFGGSKGSGSYGQSGDDTGSGGYHKSTGSVAGSIGGSGYGSSSFGGSKVVGTYGQTEGNTGTGSYPKQGTIANEAPVGSANIGVGYGGSQIPDKSFEKKYYQPTEEDNSGPSLPNGINDEENSLSSDKPVFPGPNGSIYDYKIPSTTNTASGSLASGYSKEIGQGSYNLPKPSDTGNLGTESKPCCKGPFPGPSGSIYDSKPASAVGTAVAGSTSYAQAKPDTYPSKPDSGSSGYSGGVYTSKPEENVNYGYQGTHQSSGSVASGSYHKEIQTGSFPSCSQGSCTKSSNAPKETPPNTYLEPPIGEYKPITEVVREEPKPQEPITSYITPNPQYTGPKPQGGTIKDDSSLSKPGIYNVQGVTNAGPYPSSQTHSMVNPVPEVGAGYAQQQPVAYAGPEEKPIQPGGKPIIEGGVTNTIKNTGTPGYTIITQKGPEGGIVAGSQGSGGISTGFAYSGISGSYGKYPKTSGIPGTVDENPSTEDEDRIVYISNPNEGLSYSGAIAGSSVSIGQPGTPKDIVMEGGLHEGPQGSPFTFPALSNTKIISQDKGDESGSSVNNRPVAPIYKPVDGSNSFNVQIKPAYNPGSTYTGGHQISSSGIYSSGGSVGYSSGSKVYSSHGTDNYGIASQTYDAKKNNEQPQQAKPSGTYTTTLYIDLSKPSAVESDGTKIYSKPDITKKIVENKVVFVGTGSGGYGTSGQSSLGDTKVPSGSGSTSYDGSSSGASSGIFVQGHRGIPCNSHGCGTPYRHYSNAVPSSENRNINVHISSNPTSETSSYGKTPGIGGSYGGSFGGGYSSSGSYGGAGSYKNPEINRNFGSKHEENSGGSNEGSQIGYGSAGGSSYGSHGTKHSFSEDDIAAGLGGFLSSIFLPEGSAAAKGGSYAKAGGYANSGSYSKGNSYASSSSFASASSGAYGGYGHH